jgi:ABC-2 type transport system permease protein
MNPTIASITARSLFGRKRALLLIPLPLLLIVVALLAKLSPAPTDVWVSPVVVGLGFAAVLPLIALVVGTGVLGSEIDDGTITHILAKPMPRSEIILTKLAVAAGITAVVAGVPLFVTGLIAGEPAVAFALFVAAVVGAVAYSAFFLLLSLVSRRPVLLGLVYVVLWEGVLGNLLTGTRQLSIEQYVVTIASWLSPSSSTYFDPKVNVVTSFVMAAVFAVGMTILAVRQLRSFKVAGETG